MPQKLYPSAHILEMFMPYLHDEKRLIEVLRKIAEMDFYRSVELPTFPTKEHRDTVRRILRDNDLTAVTYGECVSVYHQSENGFVPVWTLEEEAPFSHAICGAYLAGEPTFVTGHRGGKKNLMAIRYDAAAQSYAMTILDEGREPANVMHFVKDDGTDILIAANRETDEVAIYEITE